MQPSWTDAIGPLILFGMMTVVGLELVVEDFRRVARYPLRVVIGTLGQWTLLPLATAALVWFLGLEGTLAAGIVLIAAVPGGGISNVFAFIARANTALSVTLTALSSIFAVVTLPVVTAVGFDWLAGGSLALEVPVIPMIGQLAIFVLLPIGIGMRIRAQRPEFAARHAGRLRRGILVALVFFMLLGLSAGESDLVDELLQSLGIALLWTLVAGAVGFGVAVACRLDGADRFTFVIEYAVKNVGLAAIVGLVGFRQPELLVFAGAYVLVGYPLAAVACWVFRQQQPNVPHEAALR